MFLDEAMKVSGASLKTRAIIRSIYQSASAVVRARDSSGFTALSSAFSIDRGVVQGDIVSPYCFILALQLIYLRHDDNPDTGITLQPNTPRAVTIRALIRMHDFRCTTILFEMDSISAATSFFGTVFVYVRLIVLLPLQDIYTRAHMASAACLAGNLLP